MPLLARSWFAALWTGICDSRRLAIRVVEFFGVGPSAPWRPVPFKPPGSVPGASS